MDDNTTTDGEQAARSTETEPSASAGWKTEHDYQGIAGAAERPHDLVTDGGTVALPSPGDRVRDREIEDGDELVVVSANPETRADEHAIESMESTTVADLNDEYDPGSAVVDAVYLDELTEALEEWRSVNDVRDAVSFGAVNAYSFPADRLAPVEGGDGR